MINEQHLELASTILDLGKSIAPDRFPSDKGTQDEAMQVTVAWATALEKSFNALPPEIWAEAMTTVWALEPAGDRMCMPGDVKRAAYIVRDRWERIPERARMLQARREYNERLRDQQISDGSFGEVRGFVSPKMLQEPTRRSAAPESVRAGWRAVMRNVSRVS